MNGEGFEFLSARTSETDTNATDVLVFMHDACNDNSGRFGSDVLRLSGVLDYINHSNDYDTTPYRWNTARSVIYIIRRPSDFSSGWIFSLPKSQVWQGMQLFIYKIAHRGPGRSSCDNSCRGGIEMPVHIACNGEKKYESLESGAYVQKR